MRNMKNGCDKGTSLTVVSVMKLTFLILAAMAVAGFEISSYASDEPSPAPDCRPGSGQEGCRPPRPNLATLPTPDSLGGFKSIKVERSGGVAMSTVKVRIVNPAVLKEMEKLMRTVPSSTDSSSLCQDCFFYRITITTRSSVAPRFVYNFDEGAVDKKDVNDNVARLLAALKPYLESTPPLKLPKQAVTVKNGVAKVRVVCPASRYRQCNGSASVSVPVAGKADFFAPLSGTPYSISAGSAATLEFKVLPGSEALKQLKLVNKVRPVFTSYTDKRTKRYRNITLRYDS